MLPGTPVRFRTPDETRFLRHADLVLPQALVKEQFGEFAYAPGPDRFVTVDPAFEAAQVVTTQVPIVGSVTCHRAIVPALAAALGELSSAGWDHSSTPPAIRDVCALADPGIGWNLVPYSWGIVIDVGSPQTQSGSPRTPTPNSSRSWNDGVSSPARASSKTDPGHFEYVGPPVDRAG